MEKQKLILTLVTLGFLLTLCTVGGNFGNGDMFPPRDTPPVPIRQPAEFEPMEGVLIRYPFGISYQIIAEMSENVTVVTIVSSSTEQNYVETQYQNNGVNLANCQFLQAPSDSYWTRDYGPWFIFTGDAEKAIVDFTYNRPRPNDNAIPLAYGTQYNHTVYDMGLIHAGGNYMTDGQGIAVSTDLVWSENTGHTPEMINQTLLDYLGITTYHVVPDALGAYIKHIDCWAKYLSPDTIMIIQVPPSHSQYDEIEAAVHYFENQTSCYGTPYTIARVYTPTGEPYINSLILNTKVFVPITGSAWDTDALASYGSAMPGYEILGFTGSWQTTDALHCRAKGIPDSGMLYIEHTPLPDQEPTAMGFPLEATIIPYSGQNLTTNPLLYWRTTGDWQSTPLAPTDPSVYTGYLPGYPNGTTIQYYLQAEDDSGRVASHPYIGGPGAHTFMVHIVPPNIDAVQVVPPDPTTGSYVNISALITDNMGIAHVTLNITDPTGLSHNITITNNTLGDTYYYNTTYAHSGTYSFRFYAQDTSGSGTASPPVIFHVESIQVPYLLNLSRGWNLITLPRETTYTAEALGQQIPFCTVVVAFNASTQTFITHVVGTPHDDFPLHTGTGYFLYVTGNTTTTVSGTLISSATISLFSGWNLIGWYHASSTTAGSLGENITGCTLVLMFDTPTETFNICSVGTGQGDFIVEQGMGLFVFTTAASDWHGEG